MFLILFLYDINNVVVVAYAKRAECHCAAVLEIYGYEDKGERWGGG